MEGFNLILFDIKKVCDEFLGEKYKKIGDFWKKN